MPASERALVQCAAGLEDGLARELVACGASLGSRQRGGIWAEGPPGTVVRINVRSRIAERVLLHLGTVQRPDALGALSLKPVHAPGATLGLEMSGDAAGQFRPVAQRWLGTLAKPAGCTIVIHAEASGADVFVDSSGEPLHLRGYREEPGKAPLKETLAAGLLAAARWAPGTPLWDITCGSGTFVIEAAEQSRGLWPGRQRVFAFEWFPSFDPAWLVEAKQPGRAKPGLVRGSDLNAGALGVSRRNAKRAGVFEALELERLDATKLPPPPPGTPPGLVLANLPYGQRVGEQDELGALYRGVGQAVRRALPGWRFAFLVERGEERLGLPIDQVVEITNGGLRCRFVQGVCPASPG